MGPCGSKKKKNTEKKPKEKPVKKETEENVPEPRTFGEKLTDEEVKELSEKSGFTNGEVKKLYEYYKKISASQVDDNVIDEQEFEEALGLSGSKFAKRMFEGKFLKNFFFFADVMDEDGNGEVDFEEFCNGLICFTSKGTLEDRIKFTFQVYDLDGNGEIDRDELLVMLKACLAEQFLLQLKDEDLQNMVEQTFKEVDTDNSGGIDFSEYAEYASKHPNIMKNLKIELPFLKEIEEN
ncbi:calcineurin b [Anaeramoeba flamelloides]|uniref:Calcineurin b n=1 Tax=Anaeramoeba flamelloides TaxID=1746091 RepID=A0ABQ8Y9S9_9EUKA|nr:calcineurin b [Anaeramoeba flamelloides]